MTSPLPSSARRERWLARGRASIDDMAVWPAEEWTSWWSDGLEIWFSEARDAERDLAFSPIRIVGERAGARSALVAALRRLLPGSHVRGDEAMAFAMARQEAMEAGAVDVMGRRGDMRSVERAMLVLSVLSQLHAQRISELVQAALAAERQGWFETGERSALLSLVANAVFENFTASEVEQVKAQLESYLVEERNFRPTLEYCLKAYRSDLPQCIDRFYALWRYGQDHPSAKVWRSVAGRLEDVFTKNVVRTAVEDIRAQADRADGDALPTGYLAAERLTLHYSPALGGLLGLLNRPVDMAGGGFARRGLTDVAVPEAAL